MTMNINRQISQKLLWFTMTILICGVISAGILTNITLRSVEKQLPITLLWELNDLSVVLENLSEAVHAAEKTKTRPNAENLSVLKAEVETVHKDIVKLRESYVFDNLVHASAFHAVVAPAIADLKIWLLDGVSGFGPDTETTAAIVFLRIQEAFQKARGINDNSKIRAQTILEEQRTRLDRFLFSVNLLFALAMLITFSMVYLLIRQRALQKKETAAQIELRRQRDLLNSLFENVLLGIIVWDQDGVLLFSNKGFTDITGYSLKDIKTVEDWFNKAYPDPTYRNEVFLDWKKWSDKNRIIREFRITCLNGDVKDIEFRGAFLSDGRALATMSDITERKRAEIEREKLQSQIIQAQRMESIGSLAGGIAHDFNNILSSIIGYTELSLDDTEKDSVLKSNLEEVFAAAIRAKDLVKQILAFARQSNEELKPIQVHTIVKEVLRLIRSTIPTSIEIKEKIDSHSLLIGNSSQVYQLFMNLCTNAAQAMEAKGGVLQVDLIDIEHNNQSPQPQSGLKPGNYIKGIVSDTGSGIPPDIIGSIFDPYFTTKAPEEGTGMGLAMVYGIVHKYGGGITVESEPGEGTTFTVYLPIAKKHSVDRSYKAEGIPSGTEHILYIDDEAPIVKMGGRILERLGYKITTRTSSLEALELFRSKPQDFDLVITDMTMPNMNGDALAAKILAVRPDIPVILYTGYNKRITDCAVKEIGIKALGYKPIVKVELAETVRRVLNESKGICHPYNQE